MTVKRNESKAVDYTTTGAALAGLWLVLNGQLPITILAGLSLIVVSGITAALRYRAKLRVRRYHKRIARPLPASN